MNEKRFFTTLANDEYTLIQKKGNPRSTYLKYSEVVDLLNKLYEENEKLRKENNDYEKQFRIINEKLDEYIKTADTYRIPISSLKYGDELGYFNGVYQYMKKLKKDIEELEDE